MMLFMALLLIVIIYLAVAGPNEDGVYLDEQAGKAMVWAFVFIVIIAFVLYYLPALGY